VPYSGYLFVNLQDTNRPRCMHNIIDLHSSGIRFEWSYTSAPPLQSLQRNRSYSQIGHDLFLLVVTHDHIPASLYNLRSWKGVVKEPKLSVGNPKSLLLFHSSPSSLSPGTVMIQVCFWFVSSQGLEQSEYRNRYRPVLCIQKFPDWPPAARTANGTALCHWVQLYGYFVSESV
jgi:hypothetical protein